MNKYIVYLKNKDVVLVGTKMDISHGGELNIFNDGKLIAHFKEYEGVRDMGET